MFVQQAFAARAVDFSARTTLSPLLKQATLSPVGSRYSTPQVGADEHAPPPEQALANVSSYSLGFAVPRTEIRTTSFESSGIGKQP